MNRRLLITIAGLLSAVTFTHATVFSTAATNNITVQPAGPRQGANGLRFFNCEGNNNGSFASYGVADFTVAFLGLTGTVTNISRLSFRVTSSNAAFSLSGTLNVYLTSDTTTSSQQVGSPLIFNPSFLPNGVGTQLDPKWLIGTLAYDSTLGSGVTFQCDGTSLPAAAKAYIISQLNSGSSVRMIAAPNEDSCAGTFAGYQNSTYVGPELEVDVTIGGSSASVAGYVQFSARSGNVPSTVDIDFEDPGTFGLVHTAMNVPVDGSGNFSTSDLPGTAGNYLVSIHKTPWLRRTVGPVNTSGTVTGVNLVLVNGDINHDNEVSIGDYSLLSLAYNSFNGDPTWNPNADLNGDDEVSIGDYSILSSNYGQFGDD